MKNDFISYYDHLNLFSVSDDHIKKAKLINQIINKEIEFVNNIDLIDFIGNNLNGCPESFGVIKFSRLCLNNDTCENCWKKILKRNV